MEALILVATSGGPTMFARIGIMRALNRNVKWGDVRYSGAIDAVDGSSTGTRVPWMWALLRLP